MSQRSLRSYYVICVTLFCWYGLVSRRRLFCHSFSPRVCLLEVSGGSKRCTSAVALNESSVAILLRSLCSSPLTLFCPRYASKSVSTDSIVCSPYRDCSSSAAAPSSSSLEPPHRLFPSASSLSFDDVRSLNNCCTSCRLVCEHAVHSFVDQSRRPENGLLRKPPRGGVVRYGSCPGTHHFVYACDGPDFLA